MWSKTRFKAPFIGGNSGSNPSDEIRQKRSGMDLSCLPLRDWVPSTPCTLFPFVVKVFLSLNWEKDEDKQKRPGLDQNFQKEQSKITKLRKGYRQDFEQLLKWAETKPTIPYLIVLGKSIHLTSYLPGSFFEGWHEIKVIVQSADTQTGIYI